MQRKNLVVQFGKSTLDHKQIFLQPEKQQVSQSSYPCATHQLGLKFQQFVCGWVGVCTSFIRAGSIVARLQ